MNKKTHKKYVALLTMFAMVVCTMLHPVSANADTNSPFSDEEIIQTYTCIVDGVERILIILENDDKYLKVGENNPIYVCSRDLSIKFDKYGTIWIIHSIDNGIRWWSYDLTPNDNTFRPIYNTTPEDPYAYVDDVESLVLDENNEFVVGYKTFSGETYPILTLEQMKEALGISNDNPTPTPNAPTPTAPTTTPVPTPTPTAPTHTPTNTEKPVVTPEPTVSSQPTVAPKVSIKKSSGYTCLSVGNKVVSKYKLKKGVLTWKGTKKSQKVKQVKQVGFIKKSKNLVYITKKGKAYTISQKGKKKTIVKKDAKKLIFKNGYVIKIKKKSGYTNVVNK